MRRIVILITALAAAMLLLLGTVSVAFAQGSGDRNANGGTIGQCSEGVGTSLPDGEGSGLFDDFFACSPASG